MTTVTDVGPASSERPDLLDRLHADRAMIVLWAVVIGAALIVASIVLGIASVELQLLGTGFPAIDFGAGAAKGAAIVASKEVGFVLAPNWGLHALVGAPLMIWLIIQIWWHMRRSLYEATAAGMLRDASLRPVDGPSAHAQWRTVLWGCRSLCAVLVLATFVFVALDWWNVVAGPLLAPQTLEGVRLDDPVREFDWSIAHLFPGETVGCNELLVFGAVAYFYIAGW